MGIIEKCGLNGEGDGDDSSDEETTVVSMSRGSLAATAVSDATSDDQAAKVKKKAKPYKGLLNKAKILNGSGDDKKGKAVPKTSSKKSEVPKTSSKKKSEDGGGSSSSIKVKREINSRPKRLSKELAAVCGKKTLSRHEVSM